MTHASASIEALIDGIIEREGGFVDHPNDRGGPTRYGVTERVARGHGYAGSMRDLPLSKAREIYRFTYYEKPGFDRVATLSPSLAAELTDTAVNMGAATAIRFLQTALNVLNMRGEHYAEQPVDGRIGPAVIEGLRAFFGRRGRIGERVLLTAVNCLQGARYIELAQTDPRQESFVYGWLAHRVMLPSGDAE